MSSIRCPSCDPTGITIVITSYSIHYTKLYDTGSLAQIGYSNLPYLVKKHSISYLFSSDQITRSSIRIKQRTTFAGFAPEYILTKDNPSYAPLPGAREEILSAQKYYSSRMYVTPSIDKADFFKACRKKDIVHLASYNFV